MEKDKSKSRRRSDFDKKIKGHRRVIEEHRLKIKDAYITGEGLAWVPDWEKHIKNHEQSIRKGAPAGPRLVGENEATSINLHLSI